MEFQNLTSSDPAVKKEFEKNLKKKIYKATKKLKWAAILRISHFQKSKYLQTVICLRGTIGKYFNRVRGFGVFMEAQGRPPKIVWLVTGGLT